MGSIIGGYQPCCFLSSDCSAVVQKAVPCQVSWCTCGFGVTAGSECTFGHPSRHLWVATSASSSHAHFWHVTVTLCGGCSLCWIHQSEDTLGSSLTARGPSFTVGQVFRRPRGICRWWERFVIQVVPDSEFEGIIKASRQNRRSPMKCARVEASRKRLFFNCEQHGKEYVITSYPPISCNPSVSRPRNGFHKSVLRCPAQASLLLPCGKKLDK